MCYELQGNTEIYCTKLFLSVNLKFKIVFLFAHLISVQGKSFGNPVGLILILDVQITWRFVWRRIVPPFPVIPVILSPLLLLFLHPVAVGAANVAKVLVVLDVRLKEVRLLEWGKLFLPHSKVDFYRQFSATNEMLAAWEATTGFISTFWN